MGIRLVRSPARDLLNFEHCSLPLVHILDLIAFDYPFLPYPPETNVSSLLPRQCPRWQLRRSNPKESAMHYLSDSRLLTGALVFILAIIIAVRAFLDSRRSKQALLRDYFGPEYERDLLEHSSLSETEDWLADGASRSFIDPLFQKTPSK
jgi:hypothetical protein